MYINYEHSLYRASTWYLLQVFRIVFCNPFNIKVVMYKGVVGVSGQAKGRHSLPIEHRQWCCTASM